MPYKLDGNKVVRSDTGEVVKDHGSDHAKAVRHLRALKANVEEAAPAVLGVLIEAFNPGERRGPHGRWIKGDKVHVVTPQGHVDRGVVEKPAETYDAITSKGTERSTTVTVKWADGDVTHERPQDIKAGHPGERTPNPMSSSSRERGLASIEAGRRSDRPRIRPEDQSAFNAATGLGREGAAARERGASSLTAEHADTRDKLTNLPVGQSYGLHGPRGQIGRVDRTASGWQVTGPTEKHDRTHKTPSSAAGHAMKLQRTASANGGDVMMRNYRQRGEVARMNARQSQMAAAERNRRLAARARLTGKMSEADVLGALLEGR